MLLSYWWVWAVAGVALAALEVILPGFIFLGFAIGAGLTGLLMLVGLLGTDLAITALAFAVLSLASFLVLRRVVGVTEHQRKIWTKEINDN